jgi:hypothetical protein
LVQKATEQGDPILISATSEASAAGRARPPAQLAGSAPSPKKQQPKPRLEVPSIEYLDRFEDILDPFEIKLLDPNTWPFPPFALSPKESPTSRDVGPEEVSNRRKFELASKAVIIRSSEGTYFEANRRHLSGGRFELFLEHASIDY